MSPSQHGGSRPGAGRKPGGTYGEPTQPIRVPESQVETVVAYLDAYRQPTVGEDPRPVTTTGAVGLALFTSKVAAGFPSPAESYQEAPIELGPHLVIEGHELSTFCLRVKGWSMMNCGIFDGDTIVVDRALNAVRGDVVVAIVNNGTELTIKTLGEIDGKPALIPENPHFQPITFRDGDTLEIWGVVTHCLRSFKRRR